MAAQMRNYTLEDPDFVKFLLGDVCMAWVWLVARLYLGWQWLDAGRHNLTDAAVPEAPARPLIHYGWYRGFRQFMLDHEAYTWLTKLAAVGEVAIGVALILGAFTGVAACFGAFMNFNFMLAGSASTNPVLFLLALGIILAWKIAGYVGLDHWILPALGTPWRPGLL
jgi:thiosulfate dehydrogenase [quinone] large subunit